MGKPIAPTSPAGPTASTPRIFHSVQILRGVAASLVVLAHMAESMQDRIPHLDVRAWEWGGFGVDIFFPISGYVMVLAAARSAGWTDFASRRLIRIVPLYWFFTAAKLLSFPLAPDLRVHPYHFDFWHVAASFLFIPSQNDDGEWLPILPVGWTLTYEMIFYAVVATAIILRCRPIIFATAVIVPVALAGLIFDPPNLMGRLVDSLMIEMLFGMLIAEGVAVIRRIPLILTSLIAIAAFASVMFDWQIVPSAFAKFHMTLPRFIVYGVPGALLLVAAIRIEQSFDLSRLRLLHLIGDASYSTYLVHGFLTALLGTLVARYALMQPLGLAVIEAITLVLSTAAGIIFYKFAEAPVLAWLSARRRHAPYSSAGGADARQPANVE